MNVDCVSVCLSWTGTIFVFCTRNPLPTFTWNAMNGHNSYIATLSNESSVKIQRLLRPQTRLQQVRAARMGTFWAWDHTGLPACRRLQQLTCYVSSRIGHFKSCLRCLLVSCDNNYTCYLNRTVMASIDYPCRYTFCARSPQTCSGTNHLQYNYSYVSFRISLIFSLCTHIRP